MALGRGLVIIFGCLMILAGCSGGKPFSWVNHQLAQQTFSSVALQTTKNSTGDPQLNPVTWQLHQTLASQLRQQGYRVVPFNQANSETLQVQSYLLSYRLGDGVKRWLAPGYGKAEITLATTLLNSQGQKVADLVVQRQVANGPIVSREPRKWLLQHISHYWLSQLAQKVHLKKTLPTGDL